MTRPNRMLAALAAGWLVFAAPDSSEAGRQCVDLIPGAAARHGVPEALLDAIAHVESGWRGAPWDWTLNVAGQAHYAASPQEALRLMTDPQGRLRDDVAVGCMQVFTRYHADQFESAWDMLDPRNNVDYAARLLRRLYERYGSWTRAVERYHASDRASYAQRRYACRVIHYQVALGYGELTASAQRFCSGRYRRYLDLAMIPAD